MRRSIVGLIAVTALAATQNMSAREPQGRDVSARLKGDFAFVSSEHCVHSSGFGPPPLLQPLGATTQEVSTIQGTVSFDGARGGRLAGRVASTTTMVTAPPIHQADLRCSISYELQADGAFRMDRKCKASTLRGAGSVGQQSIEYSPIRVSGHLRGDVIAAADTELAIEAVTSFWGAKTPRICHRTFSATRESS